jgi:hypothetical protein
MLCIADKAPTVAALYEYETLSFYFDHLLYYYQEHVQALHQFQVPLVHNNGVRHQGVCIRYLNYGISERRLAQEDHILLWIFLNTEIGRRCLVQIHLLDYWD